MNGGEAIHRFLSHYSEEVIVSAARLRGLIFENLQDVQEQLDIPAKMIAYGYGRKYSEMVCTLIPSKKGLKLGFYKGVDLPDPHQVLQGKGKLSRYIVIRRAQDINTEAVVKLLNEGLKAYKLRQKK